jgi:hypothetical protein
VVAEQGTVFSAARTLHIRPIPPAAERAKVTVRHRVHKSTGGHCAGGVFRGRPLTAEIALLWGSTRRLPRYAEAFSVTSSYCAMIDYNDTMAAPTKAQDANCKSCILGPTSAVPESAKAME